MKKFRTPLVAAIAIGLLAGSAVGVAAQDEAADPMASSTFTAEFGDGGPPKISEDPDTGLTIVVVPWPPNLIAGELEHPQVELWRGFSEKWSARFVDLFPVFMGDGSDASETISRYFIAGDVHWNAAGHQRVAAHMAPGFFLSIR